MVEEQWPVYITAEIFSTRPRTIIKIMISSRFERTLYYRIESFQPTANVDIAVDIAWFLVHFTFLQKLMWILHNVLDSVDIAGILFPKMGQHGY